MGKFNPDNPYSLGYDPNRNKNAYPQPGVSPDRGPSQPVQPSKLKPSLPPIDTSPGSVVYAYKQFFNVIGVGKKDAKEAVRAMGDNNSIPAKILRKYAGIDQPSRTRREESQSRFPVQFPDNTPAQQQPPIYTSRPQPVYSTESPEEKQIREQSLSDGKFDASPYVDQDFLRRDIRYSALANNALEVPPQGQLEVYQQGPVFQEVLPEQDQGMTFSPEELAIFERNRLPLVYQDGKFQALVTDKNGNQWIRPLTSQDVERLRLVLEQEGYAHDLQSPSQPVVSQKAFNHKADILSRVTSRPR